MAAPAVMVAAAALAAAAPAAAKIPTVHGGSVLGGDVPLKAYASVTPEVQLFGGTMTARVAIVADRKWVDPALLHVDARFAPYGEVQPPTEVRVRSGRLLQLTWAWTLRCLTASCVPTHGSQVFHFPPARVEYLSPAGAVRYAFALRFPRVEALSGLSPSVVSALFATHPTLEWQLPLTPVPAPQYRLSPGLVFWLALTLAGVLGAAGLTLFFRWVLGLRRPATGQAPSSLRGSPLELALSLFFWAGTHGDETLQRKALERVADELPLDVRELSETARALAWSPETPEDEEVEAFSERAGIHRSGGGRDS